jgi:hypothetical protein
MAPPRQEQMRRTFAARYAQIQRHRQTQSQHTVKGGLVKNSSVQVQMRQRFLLASKVDDPPCGCSKMQLNSPGM